MLSLISLIINYSQFNYLQKVTPKQGVKGETVNLDMQVHNDFIVPLPMVDIEYDLPDDSLNLYANSARFGVPGRDKVSINQNVFCKYRGKWRVGIKKARIYDMFGLFHITLDFYKNPNYRTQSLIIAPRIVNLDFLPLPFKENASSQNPVQKITSDTAETSDIRAYINGDILKKIHWKLSLAKQELMVKNHSLSLEPDTLIYVDCSSHGFTGIKAIELEDMIAECATAVSNYLLQSYLAAKFVMVGKERTELIGRSPEDFNAVYENISNLTFDYDFFLLRFVRGRTVGHSACELDIHHHPFHHPERVRQPGIFKGSVHKHNAYPGGRRKNGRRRKPQEHDNRTQVRRDSGHMPFPRRRSEYEHKGAGK